MRWARTKPLTKEIGIGQMVIKMENWGPIIIIIVPHSSFTPFSKTLSVQKGPFVLPWLPYFGEELKQGRASDQLP